MYVCQLQGNLLHHGLQSSTNFKKRFKEYNNSFEWLLLVPRSAQTIAPNHFTIIILQRYCFVHLHIIKRLIWYKRNFIDFSVINFQGIFIRQLSCYTRLREWRLPCPSSCCLNKCTPFRCLAKSILWHFSWHTNGLSHIVCSAYQNTTH